MKSEKAKTHLGERKMMNCGEEVEIVNYYNYTDIDVRFPGCIREHVRYEKFKIGEIYMKNTKKKAKAKNNDIAKTTSASCVKRAVSAEEFRLKGRLAYYD